jgi:prophage DNA circulation protein
MSGLQQFSNSLASAGNQLNRLGADLGLTSLSSKQGDWQDRLRPASFRGVPFTVLDSRVEFGRRSVVHEYPYRDTVWVEDMGRGARRVWFSAYLVGDDCIAQRDRLIKACEAPEAITGGELVHPSLGVMKVALDGKVVSSEYWDKGRVFEITMAFIEQGQRIYPTTKASTGAAVTTAAQQAQAAAASNFAKSAFASLQSGLALAARVANTVQSWARKIQRVINDATSIFNFVQSLPGDFGRLFGAKGVRAGLPDTSVATLQARASSARTSVAVVSNKLQQAALSLQPLGQARQGALPATSLIHLSDSVHAMVLAVVDAVPSPPDTVRVLLALYGQQTIPLPASRSVSLSVPLTQTQSAMVMESALSDLIRRSLIIALVHVATQYQPGSYDEAQELQAIVIAPLEREIVIAGDAGHDDSYHALRTLYATLVQALGQRGASLVKLAPINTALPLPSLTLAHKVYRNAARADDLVQRANAIHPAFMPTQFLALAE